MANTPSSHTIFLNQYKSERMISNNVTCISTTNAWVRPHLDVVMTVKCYVFTKKHYECMITNTDKFSWAVLAACIPWRYYHWDLIFENGEWFLLKFSNSHVQPSLASHDHCCSVLQSCPITCDPTDYSMPSFLVLCCVPEFVQTHVRWVEDAIQPFHPLLPTSPHDCYTVGTVSTY